MKTDLEKALEKIPKQLSSGSKEDEVIDTTWRHSVDLSDFGWLLWVPFLTIIFIISYKLLEILWIIFSGLFVCIFLGC